MYIYSYPQYLHFKQITLPYFTFSIEIEFLHGTGRIPFYQSHFLKIFMET
jgi:hypothetical protein